MDLNGAVVFDLKVMTTWITQYLIISILEQYLSEFFFHNISRPSAYKI